MPETVLCPTCRATLRVPADAEKIRCPRCKTILLADGRPVPAERPRPSPLDGPRPAPRPALPKTFRRTRLDDAAPLPPARSAALADAAERQRVFEAFDAEAKPARLGMRFMAWGAAFSSAASVLFFVGFLATLATPILLAPLLALAAACVGMHWLLTVLGFGFCRAGPKSMRGMAGLGLGVMLVHLALSVPVALVLVDLFNLEEIGINQVQGQTALTASLLLSNLFNNLTTLTDLPVYVLGGGLARPQVLILPVLGGAVEFAKLSVLGILTNHYAVQGKDPELGYLALRFVYRIFGLVMVGMLLKLGLWLFILVTGGDPLLQAWFRIPVTLLTQGYFLWWAFAWFAQCRVMFETVEVIDPRRFADDRERLERF